MYNGSLSGAYAYGGGLGDANTPNTGDVHGTTYIALLGGKVTKDLYAAGTVGSVNNKYNVLLLMTSTILPPIQTTLIINSLLLPMPISKAVRHVTSMVVVGEAV